jgi:CRP/FNR family cyclic AMP-dependent transcriptional regulator
MSAASFFSYPGSGSEPGVPAADRGMEQLQLLPALTEDEWARLLAYTVERRFVGGETILAAGEADRTIYLIVEGSVAVQVPGRGSAGHGSVLVGPGGVIGEIAFFDGLPRSADVRAAQSGSLFMLSYERFEVLAAREPVLARMLLQDLGRILAARLRRLES